MSVARDPWFQLFGLLALSSLCITAYNQLSQGSSSGSSVSAASTQQLAQTPAPSSLVAGIAAPALRAASGKVDTIVSGNPLGSVNGDYAPITREADGSRTLTTATTREPSGADAVAWTSDGQSLVTTHHLHLVVWTGDQKKTAFQVSSVYGPSIALAPTMSGGMLALMGGEAADRVTLWDVMARREIGTLAVSQAPSQLAINQLRLASDGRTLMFGTSKGTIGFWDLVSGDARIWQVDQVHALSGSLPYILSAFAPDGATAVSFVVKSPLLHQGAREVFPIAVWDPRTGTKQRELTGHTTPISGAVYSSDGRRLFGISNGESTLYEWDVATGSLDRLDLPHPVGSHTLAVSPDGNLVALILGKDLSLVSLAARRLVHQTRRAARYTSYEEPFPSAWAFKPDSSELAAGYFSGGVMVHPVR